MPFEPKFILVSYPITKITPNDIEFRLGPRHTVFLRRIFDGQVVWRISNDGVEVREEFVRAYKLDK